MVTGDGFFRVMSIAGLLLFGFGGIAGLWFKRGVQWKQSERDSLRLTMEFSFFTMIFGILPILLVHIFSFEGVLWRLASMLMGGGLFIGGIRIYGKARLHGVHQPMLLIFLLVLSAIMLTIELMNMIVWGSPASYGVGELWFFILASLQYIAFVTYDRNTKTASYKIDNTLPDDRYSPFGERLQRNNRANHPNRTANHYTDADRYTHQHAGSQRYAHRLAFTRRGRGGTVADPVARPDKNTRR